MNYLDLRKLADQHAENWGYIKNSQKPNWYTLVNSAYVDFCLATDAIKGPEISFSSVIGQAEYDARALAGDNRDWKSFLDVIYNGQKLYPQDEAVIRRTDPLWLTRGQGTPLVVWSPRSNILRLHPKPDAVQTVTVYGIRSPLPLVNDTDTPVITEGYHDGIALRAAYLHCRKYAKTPDAITVLDRRLGEYQSYVDKFTVDNAEESGTDGWRVVAPIVPDRVYV